MPWEFGVLSLSVGANALFRDAILRLRASGPFGTHVAGASLVAGPVGLEEVPLFGGGPDQAFELVGEGLGQAGDVVP